MANIAEKDAFPTPDTLDKKGNQVWAGPGLTVLEHATILIAAQLAPQSIFQLDDSAIAENAYNLAKAVCDRLDRGDSEPVEED